MNEYKIITINLGVGLVAEFRLCECEENNWLKYLSHEDQINQHMMMRNMKTNNLRCTYCATTYCDKISCKCSCHKIVIEI